MTVTTAVILAAGRGVRLGERGLARPKGFLQLGDRPIIEESLARLFAAGIERVVIATGHEAEQYEALARRLGPERRIELAHNERFAESGSMYSLYRARALVREDFLLLESDLIYEQRALTALLEDPRRDALLLSGFTQAGDEVFVETDERGELVDMSKQRGRLGPRIAGELVGITKVSIELFEGMLAFATERFEETLYVDYETDALVAAARLHAVPCLVVPDLVWAEIDDEPALARAKRSIYPRLDLKRAPR